MPTIDTETLRKLSLAFGVSSSIIKSLGAGFLLKKLKATGARQTAEEIKRVKLPNEPLTEDTNPYQREGHRMHHKKNTYANSSWVDEIAWFPQASGNRGAIWVNTGGRKYVFPNRTFGEYQNLARDTLTPTVLPKGVKSAFGRGTGVGTQLWTAGFLAGSARYDQKPQVASLANLFRSANTKAEINALTVIQRRLGKNFF